MIRRVLGEAEDPISRGRLLGAYVEVVLAAGDIDVAPVRGRGAAVDRAGARLRAARRPRRGARSARSSWPKETPHGALVELAPRVQRVP